MKLEFSRQIVGKDSSIKFREKAVDWKPTCIWKDRRTDGQRDRRDDANSRFSQFCEHAYSTVLYRMFAYDPVSYR